MKNLYHLLVTSYMLHVTSYKLHLKPHTSNLKPITAHLLPHTSFLFLLFCFLPFAAFAQNEAIITKLDFSCSEAVTVTYDLQICGPVSVTLYYSADTITWKPAITVSGALNNQTMGKNKTITWNCATDNVSFGIFYFKIEYTVPPLPDEPDPVLINGVYWSPVNLDVGGWFCTNPWDYGGLYQWGRQADGHECYSNWISTTTTLSPTDQPGHGDLILNYSTAPYDWLVSPDDFHWNSGDENNPAKTANDPCPDGWRVPTQTELSSLFSTIIDAGSMETYPGTTIDGVWFGDGGVPSLFLPAAGARDPAGYLILSSGWGLAYWSSTPNGTDAYYFDYTSFHSAISFSWRSHAFSVRCVKEN